MFTISRLHSSLRTPTHSLLCMVLLTVLIFSSCSTLPSKDNYIKSFSAFITDVKTNAATYTQDDWYKADLKYYKYAEQDFEKYRNEFNVEDKEVLGRLKGVYNHLKLKYNKKNNF